VTSARIRVAAEVNGDLTLLRQPDGSPGWWLVSLVPPPAVNALRDPLTGLADRRLLLDRVDHALHRRPSSELTVELVVLDVDDFKGINDRYGHVAGDRLLVELAARLSASVRPADTVARWGGDEFVLLLEEGAELGGALVCERIAQRLREPVPIGEAEVQLSVSCGWVQALSSDDPVGLLHRADMEMFSVKRRRKGRDTGRLFTPQLSDRLERARLRAADLAAVATDAQARARLVVDTVQRRRDDAGQQQPASLPDPPLPVSRPDPPLPVSRPDPPDGSMEA
jgi:diguanylate cyclase (GGDEF)-like protein